MEKIQMIPVSNTASAPTFIYELLYKRKPLSPMWGKRPAHKKQQINSAFIDADIPTRSIREIMIMKRISVIEASQGYDSEMPTFVIFQPKKQSKYYAESVALVLKKHPGIRSGVRVTSGGKYQVGVTTKLWYGKKGFQEWWYKLPNKIRKAI